MRTNFSDKIPQPFVLSEEQIKRFAKLLNEHTEKLEIETVCKDGAKRSFDSVEELFDYENSDQKRINCLTLDARSHSTNEQDNIWIELEFYLNEELGFTDICHISFHLKGSDDRVTLLQQKIIEMIQGTRPHYSFFSRIDGYHLGFAFSALYIGIFYQWFFTSVINKNAFYELDIAAISVAVAMILLLGLLSCVILFVPVWPLIKRLVRVRRTYFRAGIFLIGQQKYFETNRNRWRQFATNKTLGFVISIIFGGLALYGYDLISELLSFSS